jgi:hypothetical protein
LDPPRVYDTFSHKAVHNFTRRKFWIMRPVNEIYDSVASKEFELLARRDCHAVQGEMPGPRNTYVRMQPLLLQVRDLRLCLVNAFDRR